MSVLLKILRLLFVSNELYRKFMKVFMNYYINIYFKMYKEFKKYRTLNHYYNEVLYTRYPFLISFFIFIMILMFLNYLVAYDMFYLILSSVFMLVALIEAIQGWGRELMVEGYYMGKYNRKIQRCIHVAVLLFVGSEIMVFAGFFRVYLDRCFHLPLIFGSRPIYSIENLAFYKRPLVATLVLLMSTHYMNTGYYFYLCGSYLPTYKWNFLCIVCGSIFLLIQIFEYMHLLMCYNDSVFSSCFYLLTGFHGFHVFVGLVLLCIQNERLFDLQFNPKQNTGWNMAMIYWHFVDGVWCILFLLIYIY